jgi:hypothetical protein
LREKERVGNGEQKNFSVTDDDGNIFGFGARVPEVAMKFLLFEYAIKSRLAGLAVALGIEANERKVNCHHER